MSVDTSKHVGCAEFAAVPGKRKYNHMMTIAFEVVSNREDGGDITETMLAAALAARLADCIANNMLREATGSPDDTHEIEGAA